MKLNLWLPFVTFLAYCIDKELYKAIDYLREQVWFLVEHQDKARQTNSPDPSVRRMS